MYEMYIVQLMYTAHYGIPTFSNLFLNSILMSGIGTFGRPAKRTSS